MSPRPRIPIIGVAVCGAAVLIASLFQWHSNAPAVFAAYAVALSVAAAVRPTRSAFSYLLVLAGCAVFSLSEVLLASAVAAGIAATLNRLQALEAAVMFAGRMLAGAACYFAIHVHAPLPAALALAAFTYLSVEALVAAAGEETLSQSFRTMLDGAFVYHLLATALVGVALSAGWTRNAENWLVMAPVLYLVHFFHGLWRSETGSASTTAPADVLPRRVTAYVGVIAAIAGLLVTGAILQWNVTDGMRFAAFLAGSIIVSCWKIRLPRMESAISPGFVMVLVAIAELSIPEVILVAAASVVAQSYWRPARAPKPVQVVFNASCLAIASAASFTVTRILLPDLLHTSLALFFVLAWAVLYGGNSFMVARILSLLQSRAVTEVWRECYFWSLPYFLVGAAAAAMISNVSRSEGWQVAMFILPLMALISFSYRQQLGGGQIVPARQ